MAKLLVVANETLGGRKLIDIVKARHDKGGVEQVVVIAPQNRPKAGSVIYDEAVRDAAQHRVDATISALGEAGVQATGEVMDPDPHTAVMDSIREFGIDEIIMSTHPETRSGWLRRDLVERIRHDSGLPVEHVVVDLDSERGERTHTLVVANQTVEADALFQRLKEKAAESPHSFTVVVPQDGGGGQHAVSARERLSHMLDHMRREGIEAMGGIGDPDPYTAVMNALQFYRTDDIVISTLPEMKSRWMRQHLIERVQSSTACPVEHVVADVAGAGEQTADPAGKSSA